MNCWLLETFVRINGFKSVFFMDVLRDLLSSRERKSDYRCATRARAVHVCDRRLIKLDNNQIPSSVFPRFHAKLGTAGRTSYFKHACQSHDTSAAVNKGSRAGRVSQSPLTQTCLEKILHIVYYKFMLREKNEASKRHH